MIKQKNISKSATELLTKSITVVAKLLFILMLFLQLPITVLANNTAKNNYASAFYFQKNPIGEINILITPAERNSHFTASTKVDYQLYIKNGIGEEQLGIISYTVFTDKGEEILHSAFDISIPANKKLTTDFIIPHTQEGNFTIKFVVELNEKKSLFNFNFSFGNLKKAKSPVAETPAKNKKQIIIEEPEEDDEEGEIVSKMTPINEDGTFLEGTPIIYDIALQNKYSTRQVGTIGYIVKEAVTGKFVSGKIFDLSLPSKGSKTVEFKIAAPPKPGIYNIDFTINTNTYDDTSHYAFGYEIAKINNPYHKPRDFDNFWKQAMAELAEINPEYTVQEDLEQSTDKCKIYRIEMTSLENVRIQGWLTIPRVLIGRKFPVIVGYVGYQIKALPQISEDFAGLSINVRGGDLENVEDENIDKQELLTLNINDPQRYIFRGIYMDCVRAIDFVIAHEDMGFDLTRIGVLGGSQGASQALVVSALLNKKIKTCVADNPTYCNFHINMEMQPQIREESFILKYLNKYLDANHFFITKEEILNSLSYFEIQNFMPQVKCPVLLGVGLLDPLAPAVTTIGAFNKLKREVQKTSELYTFPLLAHEVTSRHNTFKSIWLYEKMAN